VTDPTHRSFVQATSQRYLEGLYALTHCLWLPAKPEVDRLADNKLTQLAVARDIGFSIPDTLVTNRPGDALDFFQRHASSIISKSLVNMEVMVQDQPHVIVYTRPVHRRDLLQVDSVRHAPVIFQAYVPKSIELRVTVVHEQALAASIASQDGRLTRHDWRHYDDHRVRYSRFDLPRDVKRMCISLVRRLGLGFGAIDLILTPDGEFVFLEINPNGQWGFVEMATGLPIGEAIADALTEGSARDAALC
jgi:glutathione synthase/RimK-type ligase-like ATP-grasp enzyme